MPMHNLFHKSISPSYHSRGDEERAARQLCDQINYGLRPGPTGAPPGKQFLAYDYNGFVHTLYVEEGDRVVPRTERRREERVRDMKLTQAPQSQQQHLPSTNISQHIHQQTAPAPASVSASLSTPTRKSRTPLANPFETEHKPLGSNGYRAYVPGQGALRASDFGDKADDPRWSLNMMKARGELIRRKKEEEQRRR